MSADCTSNRFSWLPDWFPKHVASADDTEEGRQACPAAAALEVPHRGIQNPEDLTPVAREGDPPPDSLRVGLPIQTTAASTFVGVPTYAAALTHVAVPLHIEVPMQHRTALLPRPGPLPDRHYGSLVYGTPAAPVCLYPQNREPVLSIRIATRPEDAPEVVGSSPTPPPPRHLRYGNFPQPFTTETQTRVAHETHPLQAYLVASQSQAVTRTAGHRRAGPHTQRPTRGRGMARREQQRQQQQQQEPHAPNLSLAATDPRHLSARAPAYMHPPNTMTRLTKQWVRESIQKFILCTERDAEDGDRELIKVRLVG